MDLKLVNTLRKLFEDNNLFKPASEEDKEVRRTEEDRKRDALRSIILDSFKKTFPTAWVKDGKEFNGSEYAAIWLGEGSLDENGIPLYDSNEEIDHFMNDAGFGKRENRYYEGGIATKLIKWAEENNINLEPYDSGTLIGYFNF